MEPISEGNTVLSDIEQAIQNALGSLLSSKTIGGIFDNDSVIDEQIASFKVPNHQPSVEHTQENSPAVVKHIEPLSPMTIRTSNSEQVNNEFPFRDINLSQESIKLPFLDNPIKSTVEEMQRVLNSRGGSFPLKVEASPEEILNLFSQDLGICTSSNSSPRGGLNRTDSFELQQMKHPNKDRKHVKKDKQENAKQGMKIQERKGKSKKPDNREGKKIKELMNIYGQPDKIKKPHSDSTLGSKSEVSRNHSKKMLKNDSSKANSIAVSKRSKRRKQKFPKKIDMDLGNEYLVPDKSSKLSSKRKNRNSNLYTLKKPCLKKRTSTKIYGDSEDLNKGLGQNFGKNKANYVENGYWHSIKSKEKPFRKSERDTFFYRTRGSHNTDQIKPLKSNKSSKKLYGLKVNSKFQNIGPNAIACVNETNSMDSSEQVLNSLKRRISEESKINKHVNFSEITMQNAKHFISDIPDEKNTQDCYDMANVEFSGQPAQYHYTLPTQSSRSKEVERFLNGHYQHLPFVIGQSTNKSHNLWVNIQEALSLIKQKLPQTAEVAAAPEADSAHPLSERPVSVLSKFTSKSSKKPHECRAHISEVLYDIPESAEMEDPSGKSWENHPECMQANIDPNSVRPRCSCTSQASMTYRKVLRQIFGGDSVDFSETSESIGGGREDLLQDQGDNYKAELRKMLQGIIQEFEELNKKYEQMVMDPNSPKEELEQLEFILENKEEEIRDIVARVNEVKEASERAHVEGHRSRASFGSIEPYKSTTSIRLAQTLRRVQRFKDSLSSRPSMPYLSKSIYA